MRRASPTRSPLQPRTAVRTRGTARRNRTVAGGRGRVKENKGVLIFGGWLIFFSGPSDQAFAEASARVLGVLVLRPRPPSTRALTFPKELGIRSDGGPLADCR